MQAKQIVPGIAVLAGLLIAPSVTTRSATALRQGNTSRPMNLTQLMRMEKSKIVERCNVLAGATSEGLSLAIGFDRGTQQAVFVDFRYPNEDSWSQEFLLLDGPLVGVSSTSGTAAFLLPAVKGLNIMSSYVSQYPPGSLTWYTVEQKSNADGTSTYTLRPTQSRPDQPASRFVVKEWGNTPEAGTQPRRTDSYELVMKWQTKK